jgi:hypothetical protein
MHASPPKMGHLLGGVSMGTVTMIFAILGTATVAAFILLDLLKHKTLGYWVTLGGLAALLLSDLLWLGMTTKALLIIGGIVMILGWLGFAFGFAMIHLPAIETRMKAMWKAMFASGPKPAAAPGAYPPGTYAQPPAAPPAQPVPPAVPAPQPTPPPPPPAPPTPPPAPPAQP